MDLAGSKFGRTCKLILETAPDASGKAQNVTLPDGLTIEFSINRQSLASAQTGQFKIYGLGPVSRGAIYKDQFDLSQYRAIQFFAGYQSFMPRVFNGQILMAYSEKQKEESVTIIDCFDGGFPLTNGWSNGVVAGQKSGQEAAKVLELLAAPLPKIFGKPIIGKFPVTNMRGEVLFGNTWDLIRQKSDGHCTISDGTVYCLRTNEGLVNDQVNDINSVDPKDDRIPLISGKTGLIGAPRRTGVFVEWEMLFEPRLQLFQIVAIQSEFNKNFNGIYKVVGFRHRGIVSKSVAGDYSTTAQFLFGKGTSFEQSVQTLAG